MQKVIPALRISSYEKSRLYYEKLGFIETWKHQFEPGLPVFACVECNGMEIFLTEHIGDCQFGALVHFYVTNVDECYEQFCEKGVQVDEPPSNSLGPDIKDMLVVDPDGNRLIFLTRTIDQNR